MAPPIEISIPSTSIASPSDSKPFTQYNITLRLPLRSYVFQKRYSDFAELNTTLTKLVGAAPPAPLPAKHWFKNTVSSPELTEDRRRGLESYLRAIAESPDRRWRDTPVWRTFLNLPGSGVGGPGSTASSSGIAGGMESRLPAINTRDNNLIAASDPRTWTDLQREMKGNLSEARQQLAKRDATIESVLGNNGATSTQALEAGAAAKKALIRASNLIRALDDGLKNMAEQRKLAEGELLRRRNVVAVAKQERDGLEKVNASIPGVAGHGHHGAGNGNGRNGPVASSDKALLLARSGTGGSVRRVLGAPLPETERTRELDNSGVLQLQRDQIADQDQDVDQLAKIIRRQKEMGLAIQQEVEEQNAMLDDMDGNATRLQAKINVGNRKVGKIR
ncbi:hypothetical protein BD289DRAFT_447538 [Coniella lustricola]|uniref:Phox homologous domain-containing protein n=1 Tax=Coniella lustricola TaxID=2025994 RepID=A0A2T2ZT06_9PEZI|nr:hypothetical protein BD289DRAFT_447538 [Coniella lustricola]